MKPYKWVNRKFDFTLPDWMFPSTVERVRGTPARVEALVRGLHHAILTKRPGNDDWSIQEQIGHLLDLESLWAIRLDKLIAGAEHVTASGEPADQGAGRRLGA